MDVSEQRIDPTFNGPIEYPNTIVTIVHFYISIPEDVTTKLSVIFGYRSSSDGATYWEHNNTASKA